MFSIQDMIIIFNLIHQILRKTLFLILRWKHKLSECITYARMAIEMNRTGNLVGIKCKKEINK